MIQAWKDLRFSAKLTLIFFLVLSLTIGVITIRQSYSSFRLLEEKSLEDMENLDKSDGGDNLNLIFKVLKRGDKLTSALDSGDPKQLSDMGLRYDKSEAKRS